MARYTLVYGLRLVPEGSVTGVSDATLKLADGSTAGLTLHTLDGTIPQLRRSLDRLRLAAAERLHAELDELLRPDAVVRLQGLAHHGGQPVALGVSDRGRGQLGIAAPRLGRLPKQGLGRRVVAAQGCHPGPPTQVLDDERIESTGARVIFTDLQAGSCTMAARRLLRDHTQVVLVSGTNLPMLLDFVMSSAPTPHDAAHAAVERARSSIAAYGGPT